MQTQSRHTSTINIVLTPILQGGGHKETGMIFWYKHYQFIKHHIFGLSEWKDHEGPWKQYENHIDNMPANQWLKRKQPMENTPSDPLTQVLRWWHSKCLVPRVPSGFLLRVSGKLTNQTISDFSFFAFNGCCPTFFLKTMQKRTFGFRGDLVKKHLDMGIENFMNPTISIDLAF